MFTEALLFNASLRLESFQKFTTNELVDRIRNFKYNASQYD